MREACRGLHTFDFSRTLSRAQVLPLYVKTRNYSSFLRQVSAEVLYTRCSSVVPPSLFAVSHMPPQHGSLLAQVSFYQYVASTRDYRLVNAIFMLSAPLASPAGSARFQTLTCLLTTCLRSSAVPYCTNVRPTVTVSARCIQCLRLGS